MYSTHLKENSVIAERFVWTLRVGLEAYDGYVKKRF